MCGRNQSEARTRAGNGQEGIGMSDRGGHYVVVVVVGEEKKKEFCDVSARSCSGFVLIAQGHFSFLTPRPDRPIRASLQNV